MLEVPSEDVGDGNASDRDGGFRCSDKWDKLGRVGPVAKVVCGVRVEVADHLSFLRKIFDFGSSILVPLDVVICERHIRETV